MSKDKYTRRRRAAFDTDEKDVTKKDVKTPFFAPSEDRHAVTIIMKFIPFYYFLMPDISYADQELRGACGLALGGKRKAISYQQASRLATDIAYSISHILDGNAITLIILWKDQAYRRCIQKNLCQRKAPFRW